MKVFITGASSGIGEALAVYYAAQGATLGLVARRADFLRGLNARLGGGHACYPLDVTDAPALHDAAGDFMQRFGAPHIVIANAGVSAGTLTECEEDLAVFKRVMDTNVYGMAATFAPFIPAMKAAGGERRLVGIASVAGIRGLPGAEAYSASKAAAIAYLESLRLEMRSYGIKVVTIAPGYIQTPMTAINPSRCLSCCRSTKPPSVLPQPSGVAPVIRSFPGRWALSPSCCACCPTGCTTACSPVRRGSRAAC